VIFVQAMAVGAALVLSAGGMTAQAAGHPGECGEYKYWHHGHCEDARLKGSGKSWMSSESSQPAQVARFTAGPLAGAAARNFCLSNRCAAVYLSPRHGYIRR
jgi:hypothetical protein